MNNFKFDVNTSGIISLTAKLEALNKSAFPSAVRATLSDGAVEMKKKNILESAEKNMKVKAPNFFKANTGFERAKFNRNIENMQASVGFVNNRGIKANKAVTYGMEANETGATDTTGLMYKQKLRSDKGLVRRSKYYDKNKHAVRTVTKWTSKKRTNFFIQSAFASFNSKKPIKVSTRSGTALIQVKSIKRKKTDDNGKRGLTLKYDLLMLDRTHKKAKAKATHFNKEAAMKTQTQLEGFYIDNAEFQFKKIWK